MKTVVVRDLVLGDGVPKICVPVIAHTYSELEQTLQTISAGTFDLVEFRADFYFEDEEQALSRIRKEVGGKPILYTLRTGEEGGEIEIGDDLYRERILRSCKTADMVDIQLERLPGQTGKGQLPAGLPAMAREQGAKVVLSWHDFERTPERTQIVEKFCRMQREGCDIAKIAVMPRTRQDVLELMEASVQMLEQKAECPFIALSMGPLGKVTRVSGAFTGSCITFGTAGQMSAPGQIPSDRLRLIQKALDIV